MTLETSGSVPRSADLKNVCVIGLQWGDEGKGKVVDHLSEAADIVCRFQGGHNAGHTLVIDGVTHKLSLLPSGIVRPGTVGVIGNGVVVDPRVLLAEMEQLGVASPSRLKVAANAHLVLPVHSRVDKAREQRKQGIGTTGRGIGPAYEDKVARRGIRFVDLGDADALHKRVTALLAHHNIYLAAMGEALEDVAETVEALLSVRDRLMPYTTAVWQYLDRAMSEGKSVLFEGAQGSWLDNDFGTFPYVTSSNTSAGQVACGLGIGPGQVGRVVGVTKAYATRVGHGPFPTELDDETGRWLRSKGAEFGTVTGRERRCGWFDAVAVRQACRLSGVESLALTKLDVLDGLEEVRVCTGYRRGGERGGVVLETMPLEGTDKLEPVYESWEGWEGCAGVRDWDTLPLAARRYIARLEALTGVEVGLVSTGPERTETIVRREYFG